MEKPVRRKAGVRRARAIMSASASALSKQMPAPSRSGDGADPSWVADGEETRTDAGNGGDLVPAGECETGPRKIVDDEGRVYHIPAAAVAQPVHHHSLYQRSSAPRPTVHPSESGDVDLDLSFDFISRMERTNESGTLVSDPASPRLLQPVDEEERENFVVGATPISPPMTIGPFSASQPPAEFDNSLDTATATADAAEHRGWLGMRLAKQAPSTPGFFSDNKSDGSRQASGSARSRNGPLRHRSARLARSFFLGPRPRARLTIEHYRWWPLRGVENAWLKLTSPVAWKDPRQEVIDSRTDLESASSVIEQSLRAQRRANEEDTDGDLWWASVRRDLRRNWLHWLLLSLTFVGWALGFAFLAKSLWYEGSVVTADGTSTDTIFLGCTTTFWSANSGCGLDGTLCAPFSGGTPYDFRCPASCETTTLGGPRAVGNELPAYVPLVVGGTANGNGSSGAVATTTPSDYIYRGDSFVCAAAIHAGILPREDGGCGRLWLGGAFSGFGGVERNGITSTPFDSTFPVSFNFDDSVQGQQCSDRRSDGYILDVILLAFVGFILRPKRIVFFFTLVCVGFWHINFLSYPRQYPMSVGSAMGDFLPTLFIAYGLWRVNFRYTLPAFARLPLESNVWIQGLFWIGVMMNLVFVNVPLNRLVASDITAEPGALTSLIVIIVVVLVLAVNQVRVIRKVGLLPKYLTLAIVGGILVGLLAAVPTTGLRLHHYIIALVLLPFCAFETRLSLLYSAFLLGVFLNGVGRWGYDGIIEDVATIRGAATSGSMLPAFLPAANWTGVAPYNVTGNLGTTLTAVNLTADASCMTGSLQWEPVPSNQSDWDSFQLLIDDVLRLQANETSFDLASIASDYVTLGTASNTSTPSSSQLPSGNFSVYPGGGSPANVLATLAEQPHFARLAFYNTLTGALGDFTMAATLYFNGTFVAPADGAT